MSKFRNIVLPATTTPSSPKDGQLYHDSTLNKIRVYIDGQWYNVDVSPKNLAASKVAITNSNGDFTTSSVIVSELEKLIGIEHNIQTQLDHKLNGFEMDYSLRVAMGSATLSGINGTTSATTGTIALANFDGTTTIGKIPHVTFNTTSTAGSTCGVRTSTSPIRIGGGFKLSTIFKVQDASNVPYCRHFFGATDSSSATAMNSSSNNNQIVNTLTNFFGFAHDSYAGDTNFCIYHNGNTAGNTVKIDLGSSFPVTNTGEIYQIEFYNHPASLDIHYRVTALVADVKAYGTISGTASNLPTGSQLFAHNQRFNGGSSSQVKFDAGSIFIRTFG